MCQRLPDDTWYSYAFRQVCEKSWAVLAVAGFVTLWWYSEKADAVQAGIIDRSQRNQETISQLLNNTLKEQSEQTRAIIVLTTKIEELSKRIERIELKTNISSGS